jgi:hypothetical protein
MEYVVHALVSVCAGPMGASDGGSDPTRQGTAGSRADTSLSGLRAQSQVRDRGTVFEAFVHSAPSKRCSAAVVVSITSFSTPQCIHWHLGAADPRHACIHHANDVITPVSIPPC